MNGETCPAIVTNAWDIVDFNCEIRKDKLGLNTIIYACEQEGIMNKKVLLTTEAGDDVELVSHGTASNGEEFFELKIPDLLTRKEMKTLALKLAFECGNTIQES